MLKLGEEGLIAHIRTIGLFRTKARNLIGLCQALIDQHAGQALSVRDWIRANGTLLVAEALRAGA